MRLFRRNALGIYAVYAAADRLRARRHPDRAGLDRRRAVRDLVVHRRVTIYLSVLDLGVGPTIVRFAGEARGRRAPEETNCARLGGARALRRDRARHPPGRRCSSPGSSRCSSRRRTTSSGRRASRRSSSCSRSRRASRSASSTTCSSPSSASTSRTSRTSSRPSLYAALVALLLPNGGGLILLGALTLGDDAPAARAAARRGCAASCPDLRLRRAYVTRRADPRADRVQLEQLPHPRREQGRLRHRRDRRRDRARRRGGGALRDPGEALHARVRARQRRHQPALSGVRGARGRRRGRSASAGCCSPGCAAARRRRSARAAAAPHPRPAHRGLGRATATAESSPVLALLALVAARPPADLPVHAVPDRARAAARDRAGAHRRGRRANVVLSVVLAKAVGIWGVALSDARHRRRRAALRRAAAGRARGVAPGGGRSRARRLRPVAAGARGRGAARLVGVAR